MNILLGFKRKIRAIFSVIFGTEVEFDVKEHVDSKFRSLVAIIDKKETRCGSFKYMFLNLDDREDKRALFREDNIRNMLSSKEVSFNKLSRDHGDMSDEIIKTGHLELFVIHDRESGRLDKKTIRILRFPVKSDIWSYASRAGLLNKHKSMLLLDILIYNYLGLMQCGGLSINGVESKMSDAEYLKLPEVMSAILSKGNITCYFVPTLAFDPILLKDFNQVLVEYRTKPMIDTSLKEVIGEMKRRSYNRAGPTSADWS